MKGFDYEIDFLNMSDGLAEFFFAYFAIISIAINYLTNKMGIREYSGMIQIILVVGVILLGFQTLMRKIKLYDVLFCLAAVAAVIVSWMVFKDVRPFLEPRAPGFIFTVLPYFFVGILFGSGTIRTERLLILARIDILFVGAMMISRGTEIEQMGIAYRMLPYLMLVTYSVLALKKYIDIIFMLGGAAVLVLAVSRGPILLFLVFFVIVCLIKHTKKTIVAGIIAAAVFGVTVVRDTLFQALYSIFTANNWNTRIFRYLMQGELTKDNGRQPLFEAVSELIHKRPFFGNGLYSDRMASMSVEWVQKKHPNGNYVHNIFYEVICHWGYILGITLLGLLAWLLIKAARIGNSKQRIVILILSTAYIGRLLVSSSYLEEEGLFVLIGFAAAVIRNRKIEKEAEGSASE